MLAEFDDEDEEGELPDDGEVPEEASQQSKRIRFEQDSHHKPFRYTLPDRTSELDARLTSSLLSISARSPALNRTPLAGTPVQQDPHSACCKS